jgi:hypothetical protein
MATQSTPHTQTQQDTPGTQADLEPNQVAQESGQDQDADIYQNMDGAQTGGTRAFNATASDDDLTNTVGQDFAGSGHVNTRTPHSDQQGITNHSANEESARNEKVVSERPDAQQGVDLRGHKA